MKATPRQVETLRVMIERHNNLVAPDAAYVAAAQAHGFMMGVGTCSLDQAADLQRIWEEEIK